MIYTFEWLTEQFKVRKWDGVLYYIFHHHFWSDLKHTIIYSYQRIKTGHADCDWFNLDSTLRETLLLGLKGLRRYGNSYPADVTAEEWDVLLDETILHLQYLEDNEWLTEEERVVWLSHRNAAFDFLDKHFESLWD